MFNRLIALPSGEWVDPEIITGIRLEVRKIKQRVQVRVLLDTKRRDGLFIVPFGEIAVAQCWMANIGAACSTGEYLNDDDDDQSFEFLDAVEQHRRHPGTFAMPSTHKLD